MVSDFKPRKFEGASFNTFLVIAILKWLFKKIFFGKYGIFGHAQHSMAYGSKRYVCDTELKLRLCIKSVYNIKSLALTLSFPQVFKDAATERRVKFSSKFKHPEYYDIPKPHPWKSMIFK